MAHPLPNWYSKILSPPSPHYEHFCKLTNPEFRVRGGFKVWLTCSTTQCPSFDARSKALSATTSCPCPNETLCKFLLSVVNPNFLPSASTSFKGSTPGESIKNIGVAGPLSSYETANSIERPSTYFVPSFSSTKFLKQRNTRTFY